MVSQHLHRRATPRGSLGRDSRGRRERGNSAAPATWRRLTQGAAVVWTYTWCALVALFWTRVGLLCVMVALLTWTIASHTLPQTPSAHAAARRGALLSVPGRAPRAPTGIPDGSRGVQPPPAPVSGGAVAPAAAPLAQAIRHAFHAYGEPYEADAGLLVLVSQQFGLDAAIPAGLFLHEDGNLNNRTLFPDRVNWLVSRDRNPGNIKCMYDPCYEGFQVYPTYRAGILDWFRLYDYYYYDLGIHDLGHFIATYCPPGVDGNGSPVLYANDVVAKAAAIRAGW
jgi:hypothetical protein